MNFKLKLMHCFSQNNTNAEIVKYKLPVEKSTGKNSGSFILVCLFFFSLALLFFTPSCKINRITYLEYAGGAHCSEHHIDRTYLNSNTFVERDVRITSDSSVYTYLDTFKIESGVWYHYCCGGWRKYFDKEDFLNQTIIEDCTYDCLGKIKRVPIKRDTFHGQVVYKYEVRPRDYDYFVPAVYFDPAIGNVKIMNGSSRCKEENLVKYKKGKKTVRYTAAKKRK